MKVTLDTLVVEAEAGEIESEQIVSGNYHFIFFPAHKEANIIETGEGPFRKVHRIPLDELTPELAVHWAQKLKKYVLFQ